MDSRLTEFANGNVGAMTVLALVPSSAREEVLADLEAQQLKGELIWIAYSYICRNDFKAFLRRLKEPNFGQEVSEFHAQHFGS